MTDAELLAASLPAAADLLREHGLDGAADVLVTAQANAELLRRAVAIMIEDLRDWFLLRQDRYAPIEGSWGEGVLAIIAEYRGETLVATLARLNPPTEPDHG